MMAAKRKDYLRITGSLMEPRLRRVCAEGSRVTAFRKRAVPIRDA